MKKEKNNSILFFLIIILLIFNMMAITTIVFQYLEILRIDRIHNYIENIII